MKLGILKQKRSTISKKCNEHYYRNHYKEPNTDSLQEINTFLESLDLHSIGEVQNKALMVEITKEETEKAVSILRVNKAPGKYGF